MEVIKLLRNWLDWTKLGKIEWFAIQIKKVNIVENNNMSICCFFLQFRWFVFGTTKNTDDSAN